MGRRSSRRNKLEENEYYVERIVSRKMFGDKYLYEVKWEGYPDSENTWIAEEDFTDVDFVRKFNKAYEETKKKKTPSSNKRGYSVEKISNNQTENISNSFSENDHEMQQHEIVVSSSSSHVNQFTENNLMDLKISNTPINVSCSSKKNGDDSFLDVALKNGAKIGKLAASDIKFVISKFCGLEEVKYLLEAVTGDILLVELNQLDIDKVLDKQLKEANDRHERAKHLFLN